MKNHFYLRISQISRSVTCLIILCLTSASHAQSVKFNKESELQYPIFKAAYSAQFDIDQDNIAYVAANNDGLIIYDTQLDQIVPIDTFPPSFFEGLIPTNITQTESYLYVSTGGFQGGDFVGLYKFRREGNGQLRYLSHWMTTEFEHGCAIVKIKEDVAIMGVMEDGLLFIDVSREDSLTFIGHLTLDQNFPKPPGLLSVPHSRGLAIHDNYAYVCHDAGGLRVVDISDPFQPKEVAKYVNQWILENAARAYNNISIQFPYAFIAVDYCGLEIVDISNPLNPQTVDHLNLWDCDPTNWRDGKGHANELFIHNNEILFVSGGDSDILALDITDPRNIKLAGQHGMPYDSMATWGFALGEDRILACYIDNRFPYLFYPQPFYSEYSGVQLLSWSEVTSIDEGDTTSWTISPNPVSSKLRISGSFQPPLDFKLINAFGQIISNGTLTSSSLDVGALAPGLYKILLKGQDQISVIPFLKV